MPQLSNHSSISSTQVQWTPPERPLPSATPWKLSLVVNWDGISESLSHLFLPLWDSCPFVTWCLTSWSTSVSSIMPNFHHSNKSLSQVPCYYKRLHHEFWKIKMSTCDGRALFVLSCWSAWNPWLPPANPVMLSSTTNASLTSTAAGWWWPRNLPHCNTLGQSPRHQKEEIPGQA